MIKKIEKLFNSRKKRAKKQKKTKLTFFIYVKLEILNLLFSFKIIINFFLKNLNKKLRLNYFFFLTTLYQER